MGLIENGSLRAAFFRTLIWFKNIIVRIQDTTALGTEFLKLSHLSHIFHSPIY